MDTDSERRAEGNAKAGTAAPGAPEDEAPAMTARSAPLRLLMVAALALGALPANARNLQLVDEDPASGFALYRSGKPNADDLREMCDKHVTAMLVLSGDAAECEGRFGDVCPTLVVVKEVNQSDKVALSVQFLQWFDAWVLEAKRTGKKIAFRCDCGCHRTGRLAAYYQMKYLHVSVKEAKADMRKYGHLMAFHGWLQPQVDALADYIAGRPCSTPQRYCVRPTE